MTQTWLNNDKLYIKYGTTQAASHRAGEYDYDGPRHLVELKLSLADLTQTETILDDVTLLPKGAIIEEIEVLTITAAATGTAVDLGLIKTDRTTEYDYNGLLAAFPTASMDTGDLVRLSEGVGTYMGAVLGVALTETAYLSASMTDATAFTAGDIRIRLFYTVA